jgi:hypothetical protein
LTPSGRFETNTKVCLSFSAYHPELWQPAWGIRLILEALISFLPTPADGAIGALDYKPAEKKRLAKQSIQWACPKCCANGMSIVTLLPPLKVGVAAGSTTDADTTPLTKFQKEIEQLQRLQLETEGKKNTPTPALVVEDTPTKTIPANDDATVESSIFTTSPANEETNQDSRKTATAAATTSRGEQEESVPTTSTSSPVAQRSMSAAAQTRERIIEHQQQQSEQQHAIPDPRPHDATAAPPVPQPQPPNDVQENNDLDEEEQAALLLGNGARGAAAAAANNHNPSWIMEPLLQFMILLLAVICYLFLQKGQALLQELEELRLLDALLTTST